MITVISGTNRPGSRTRLIANHVVKSLQAAGAEEVNLLDLCDLDHGFFFPKMYDPKQTPTDFQAHQEALILNAAKVVFVTPEYNGSFPGALKTFIDAISVHRYAENFKQKPVALIGVSTGRAGNLRGLDHLADILLHMGAHLVLQKMPISQVDKLLDEAGELVDEATISAIAKQSSYLMSI